MAGVFVVLMILVSAIIAGYVSIDRLFQPQEVTFLWAVAAASIIGFIGKQWPNSVPGSVMRSAVLRLLLMASMPERTG
jgi:divalent metal cation (Fe/Co/Zn/Cd) transporter